VAGLKLKHTIYKRIRAWDSPSFSDNPSRRILQHMLIYDIPFWLFLLHPQKRLWKAMTWPEVKKLIFSFY
jgi:hypothetical protein